jgi:glycosyltransferase involved in cell wall biosynthesis
MPEPRLSILCPTYNRAHMLPRFLDSVRCVTTDCEILVVDNASTDDTERVAARFRANDKRIRYIRNSENIGVVANYNRAMELAQGAYVCCMGDDDAVLPGNFERKAALLDANPATCMVYSLWRRMDEHGRSLGTCIWPGLLRYSYVGGRNEFMDMLPAGYIMLQSVLFRRSLFEKHGGFALHAGITANHDWDMLLRWVLHADTAFIAEPLVCVGVHAQSTTESVCRAQGDFARGRIALWRKWLVAAEDPPVLDDTRWQRMREAFLPDLHYEFGADERKVEGYLHELDALRREHECKVLARFEARCGAAEAAAGMRPVPIAAVAPIVWHAPLRDPSGYADEARNFLFALDSAQVPLAARELRWNDRSTDLSPEREKTLIRLTSAPAARDAVHVWHILAPHFQRDSTAVANVGRTMFETDRLPAGWVDACNQMDAVWVPTAFNRETFAGAGVSRDKLRVVPGAIDTTPFDPDIAPLHVDGARGFNFLSVFDWTLRKGWDVLLQAYVEEFRAAEDVALIFKVHSSPGLSTRQVVCSAEQFLVGTLGRDPEHVPDIIFQDTTVSDSQMPALYRAADCYVMPTRGEGWGRPLMEAMAMGLPTIATNWSGQTEFMNEANSLLIDCTVVDVPEAGFAEIPTYRGHRWAEPSVAHLRRLMRLAFDDRDACRLRGLQAREDIASRYNYRIVAERIAEETERLR